MITKILKFGGSSLGTPERVKMASEIILDASKKNDIAVVVSAFQGITDHLLKCASLAVAGKDSKKEVEIIKNHHIKFIKKLIKKKANQKIILKYVETLINELSIILENISKRKEALPKEMDIIASFGERFSAFIIANYIKSEFLEKSYFVDAREIIKTDDIFINASVNFNSTNKLIKKFFSKSKNKVGIPIITGFLSSTQKGETTTLGRGGSDYSAAILGVALGVKIIEIWTDVDGIMSADPRLVKNAVVLNEISYEEAVEMAYFGAKVIHPATMLPAIKKGIPILIKNTFNSLGNGSLIVKKTATQNPLVKGVILMEDISLIIVKGVSLAGIPGSAARVFEATKKAKSNVILISQASSEHTICLAIKTIELKRTLRSLRVEFKKETKDESVSVEFIPNQVVISIVGDGMRGTPGISGNLFGILGDNKISVTAIAQGGSERSISLTVNTKDKIRALNLIHDRFVFNGIKNIFLVGVGNIGGMLLRQICELDNNLLKVCGIINSKKMLLDESGIKLNDWKKALEKGSLADFKEWMRKIKNMDISNKIFVDCTASDFVTNKYIEMAHAGFNIVSPNKKFNVLPIKKYKELRDILAKNNKKFGYETNVGAGLPLLSTLKDLVSSGDKIVKIEGIFSGTLSYILNSFGENDNFSDIVIKAKTLGYTEPDPREDLNGLDVGRKLLILAREIGLDMNISDVKIENLVIKKLRKIKELGSFMEKLKEYDFHFKNLLEEVQKDKKVLRYVAKLENGKASACLESISKDNPLAFVRGADNIFVFYTKRYPNCPLIIQGPGAGAEVTASGVLSDILKI
ncbi:bifunctional aspartate kinase/homoserine dehydrogenase I [Patescibacteria group bacterium]|nr:bifunctional aspartate kinase/homoserine dehydrogenase I [Patescibacteria group bacterium]